MDPDEFDRDSLGSIVHLYPRIVRSSRTPGLIVLHYADMIRDLRATVRHLADAAKVDADDALIDALSHASEIDTMRSKAERHASVGGTGFWKSDAVFFATGGTGNWTHELSEAEVAAYRTKIPQIVPDSEARS